MKIETLFRLIILVIPGCIILLSGLYRSKARHDSGLISRHEEGWLAVFLRLSAGLILLVIISRDLFLPQLMG